MKTKLLITLLGLASVSALAQQTVPTGMQLPTGVKSTATQPVGPTGLNAPTTAPHQIPPGAMSRVEKVSSAVNGYTAPNANAVGVSSSQIEEKVAIGTARNIAAATPEDMRQRVQGSVPHEYFKIVDSAHNGNLKSDIKGDIDDAIGK